MPLRLALVGVLLTVLFLSATAFGTEEYLLPSEDVDGDFLVDPTTYIGDIKLTDTIVEKTPKWSEIELNPPVSGRRAIRLADKVREKLVKDIEGFKWRLDSARLSPWGYESPTGHWFWEVVYWAQPQSDYVGPHTELRVVVLMDGAVVEPQLIKRKPDEDR